MGVGVLVGLGVVPGRLMQNTYAASGSAATVTTGNSSASRIHEVNRQALGLLKLTQEQEGQLLGMILESRRIDAIKYLKSLKPELSLKDAKDRVEAILPIQYPGR